MSRLFSLAVVVALAAIVSWGCTSSDAPIASSDATTESEHDHADHAEHAAHDLDHEHAAVGKICGSCGDAKGSESCCSESAEKCANCGLNKGSLLCCVELDESAAGKDLCGKCGQVAGSDVCCADDAETCVCGMAKGSPLCCKLKKDI